jgi:dihydrofolate reductase
MTISIIVAVAENGIIGRQGTMLPWKLPADLARFKKLTMGHSIIMGRKTYDTIGRPLPGRQNIVVSRNQNYRAEGCETATSLADAFKKAKSEEVFVIGGGELFKQTLPLAAKLYLTCVHASPPGDVTFEYDDTEWQTISSETYPADDKNEFAYSFINLQRRALGRL